MKDRIPFQLDRETFARKSFISNGRRYKIGDIFPWKTLHIPQSKAINLYVMRYIDHDDKKEAEMSVGDGLEMLNMDQLKELVKTLNEKAQTKYPQKYNSTTKYVKMTTSKTDRNKQIGLIRQARRNGPQDIEVD